MAVEDDIACLEEFRALVERFLYLGYSPQVDPVWPSETTAEWQKAQQKPEVREVRRLINTMKMRVGALLEACGCGVRVTQHPAPAVGGPIVRFNILDLITENRSSHNLELTTITDKIDTAIGVLRGRADAVTAESPINQLPSRNVFVVHGHDDAAREEVARFLSKADFNPVILHEQASGGRTVIEKLEKYADVGFAVVLLTPDDVGSPKDGKLQPRARQNVVAELFYFIGKLGRERVCAIKKGELETPSDIGGVVYVPLDAGGGWRQKLLRELEAVGYEVDWGKAMR
jgi:predicted nucleotide-binding protein